MWKCSNCGTIGKDETCEKCGLLRKDTLFDDIYIDDEIEEFIEPIELPDPEQKKKNTMLKAKEELKREKRVAKLEKKLDKAMKIKGEAYVEEGYVAAPRAKKKRFAGILYAFVLITVVAASAVLIVTMNDSKNKALEQAENEKQEMQTKITTLESELNNTKSDYEQVNSQATDKESENSNLRSEQEGMKSEIRALTEENGTLTAKVDGLNSEISSLKAQLSTAQNEVESLRGLKSKVKVLDFAGTYHNYGCSAISSDRYWIYDRDQVVSNSNYKKCSVCH